MGTRLGEECVGEDSGKKGLREESRRSQSAYGLLLNLAVWCSGITRTTWFGISSPYNRARRIWPSVTVTNGTNNPNISRQLSVCLS